MTDKEVRSFIKLTWLMRDCQKKYFELRKKDSKAKKDYQDGLKAKLEPNSMQNLAQRMLETGEEAQKALKESFALEQRLDNELKRLYAKAKEINETNVSRLIELSNYGKN